MSNVDFQIFETTPDPEAGIFNAAQVQGVPLDTNISADLTAGELIISTGSALIGSGNPDLASTTAIKIGDNAGITLQGSRAIAIGSSAGRTSQGAGSIAIGVTSGSSTQGASSIAIGNQAGLSTQGAASIAIGKFAGNSAQGANAIAIGESAGVTQGALSICVGLNSIATGTGSVVIGNTSTAVGFTTCMLIGDGLTATAFGQLGIGVVAGATPLATGWSTATPLEVPVIVNNALTPYYIKLWTIAP